jgi:hypothetical protein
MKSKFLYRAASVLFVLFAAGHTFGFLNFRPPTAEAVAVRDAMDRVHFVGNHSYGGFYIGLGLYATVYLLFSAFLAWQLGTLSARAPQAARPLGWTLFAVQLASLALAYLYFGAPPMVFSALTAICLFAAAGPWNRDRGERPDEAAGLRA